MKQERNKDLTVQAAVPVPQVVEYLEQLVAALKSGAVHVHVGGHELVLGPRGVLGLKLRARQKRNRQRLTLDLSWRKRPLTADEDGLELSIRAAPPEAATAASEADEADEAAELVERADEASAVERDAGDAALVEAAAVKGEAHEGERLSMPANDEGAAS